MKTTTRHDSMACALYASWICDWVKPGHLLRVNPEEIPTANVPGENQFGHFVVKNVTIGWWKLLGVLHCFALFRSQLRGELILCTDAVHKRFLMQPKRTCHIKDNASNYANFCYVPKFKCTKLCTKFNHRSSLLPLSYTCTPHILSLNVVFRTYCISYYMYTCTLYEWEFQRKYHWHFIGPQPTTLHGWATANLLRDSWYFWLYPSERCIIYIISITVNMDYNKVAIYALWVPWFV